MAHAVGVQYDVDAVSLRIHTAIVGLPPVFIYAMGARIILASDLWTLRSWPGVTLRFDPVAVAELGAIGFPTRFRTLFEGVSLLPPGSAVEILNGTSPTVVRAWTMPKQQTAETWAEFTAFQQATFMDSLKRIRLEEAVLSLTGGLDSRTILAAMLDQGRQIPAVTMGWNSASLDAITASDLCSAYDIPHDVIKFDDSFGGRLSEYALEASRLSGGLVSVHGATEVAFYDQVGRHWKRRISGNLGNQVGRGGVEGVSARNADLSILSSAFSAVAKPDTTKHWMAFEDQSQVDLRVVAVQQEACLPAISNFAIGHHFMVQESPFASRGMIEAMGVHPHRDIRSLSRMRLRTRDLRHRLLGEPAERSFQRQLIRRVGGPVATIPINWGWRAHGPPSLRGGVLGVSALLDALALKMGRDHGRLRSVLSAFRILGKYEFRRTRRWCSRAFVEEMLFSRLDARETGLFRREALSRMVKEHFTGRRDHHASLLFAIDLAAAHAVFIAGVIPPDKPPPTH